MRDAHNMLDDIIFFIIIKRRVDKYLWVFYCCFSILYAWFKARVDLNFKMALANELILKTGLKPLHRVFLDDSLKQ